MPILSHPGALAAQIKDFAARAEGAQKPAGADVGFLDLRQALGEPSILLAGDWMVAAAAATSRSRVPVESGLAAARLRDGAATEVSQIEGAADPSVEQVSGLPILTVVPERESLSRYGLNVEDLQDLVATGIGGLQAGLTYEDDRRFKAMVRLPEDWRRDLDGLRNRWTGAVAFHAQRRQAPQHVIGHQGP